MSNFQYEILFKAEEDQISLTTLEPCLKQKLELILIAIPICYFLKV